MDNQNLNDIKLDMEFMDGSMRALLVAIRSLLRENPEAVDNLKKYLEHCEKNGFNLNHTSEQDHGLHSTLKQLCS